MAPRTTPSNPASSTMPAAPSVAPSTPHPTSPSPARSHALALATVGFWGFTFISTKILLEDFAPIEILFVRFVMGLAALCVLRPHMLKLANRRHELLFLAAGVSGITLYYLLENVSLVYTTASNASVIVSTAPLFTAIVGTLAGQERALTPRFFAGFALAMAGIALVSFTGGVEGITLGSPGDLIALAAAATWGVYSIAVKRIADLGYETIAATKRIFAWGILFMVPALFLMGARPDLARLADPVNLLNLLFLGLIASAWCFVGWNRAVAGIGPSKASVYIYLTPAITVAASVAILGEAFTPQVAAGIALTVAGLFVSQEKQPANDGSAGRAKAR